MPIGLQFDDAGKYWIPDERFDDALDVITLRKDGVSWREIAAETSITKDTARRVWDRKKRYLAEK